MKRILYFTCSLLTLVFFSCQKESYVAKFDESPQERIGAQVELVKNALIGATDGWIGTLSTGLGGGYAFYMTFDDKEYVKMYADLTNATASTVKESRYRVKADMGADLIFDTYTYITLLNDPTPSVFGGSGRDGFRSDIEFIYERSTADSLIFVGKRYRQIFSLVKATAAQKARYTNGEYLSAINGFKNFFVTNPNAYFDIDGNTKVAVEPNVGNTFTAGKRIALTAIYGDSVASATSKYAFTIDKMDVLGGGIPFAKTFFNRLSWKDASTLAIYDAAGKEYIIKNNATPLLPLYKLWGSKYSGMLSNFQTIYAGTSADGRTLLNTFHTRLASRPPLSFAFNFGRLNLVWDIINSRLRVDAFHSQNGGSSGWVTTGTFRYAIDDTGTYTFSTFSGWSGGYVEAILTPLRDFLLNNKVTFDYHIDGTVVYAKMSSITNPNIVMTFALTN